MFVAINENQDWTSQFYVILVNVSSSFPLRAVGFSNIRKALALHLFSWKSLFVLCWCLYYRTDGSSNRYEVVFQFDLQSFQSHGLIDGFFVNLRCSFARLNIPRDDSLIKKASTKRYAILIWTTQTCVYLLCLLYVWRAGLCRVANVRKSKDLFYLFLILQI